MKSFDPLRTLLSAVSGTPRALETLLARSRICPSAVHSFVGRIHVDAPLTFLFLFICVAVMAVDSLLEGSFALDNLATPPFQQFSPFVTTWRQWRHRPVQALRVALWDCANLFTGSCAHTDWGHLRGNVVSLLLVAPTCERALGPHALLKIMGVTSFASSAMHLLSTLVLGKDQLFVMGASDIVFSFIILNSLVGGDDAGSGSDMRPPGSRFAAANGTTVPLSFLCQVGLWCWKEFAAQFLRGSKDHGISHVAHLTGAAVGTYFGWTSHVQSQRAQRAGGFMDMLLRPVGVGAWKKKKKAS